MVPLSTSCFKYPQRTLTRRRPVASKILSLSTQPKTGVEPVRSLKARSRDPKNSRWSGALNAGSGALLPHRRHLPWQCTGKTKEGEPSGVASYRTNHPHSSSTAFTNPGNRVSRSERRRVSWRRRPRNSLVITPASRSTFTWCDRDDLGVFVPRDEQSTISSGPFES